MALQTSGPISLNDIQTEFGGSNPISLSEYYGAASGIPASGAISIGDFYGASASQFSVTLYSGNSSTQSISVGFEPDMVIIKRRGGTGSPTLFDRVRGDYYPIWTDVTSAQAAQNTNTVALTSTGFSLGGSSLSLNNSGDNYVAYAWQAGGSPVTNTDGTITSSVSANPELGFSIVDYAGEGSFLDTIGHGLGVVPEVTIRKSKLTSGSWGVVVTGTSNLVGLQGTGSTALGTGAYGYAYLNTNAGFATTASTSYASTATTFKAWVHRELAVRYTAYCFASVAGVSKIGTYTGNGNTTTGVTVTTGFEPSFVLLKRANSTSDWLVLDNLRDTTNPRSVALFFDLNIAEIDSTTYNTDFNSTGFTVKGSSGNVNASGSSYLYIAIA